MQNIETRTIDVQIVKRRDSDLLIAISGDLPGLMVPGRSDQEVVSKLPDAIREILEAQGNKVVSVSAERESDQLPPAFIATRMIASAKLEAPK